MLDSYIHPLKHYASAEETTLLCYSDGMITSLAGYNNEVRNSDLNYQIISSAELPLFMCIFNYKIKTSFIST